MKHPLAHRVIRPTEYTPVCATDIRKTIAKARKGMSPKVVRLPPLVVAEVHAAR